MKVCVAKSEIEKKHFRGGPTLSNHSKKVRDIRTREENHDEVVWMQQYATKKPHRNQRRGLGHRSLYKCMTRLFVYRHKNTRYLQACCYIMCRNKFRPGARCAKQFVYVLSRSRRPFSCTPLHIRSEAVVPEIDRLNSQANRGSLSRGSASLR